jgi:hypothetical protein
MSLGHILTRMWTPGEGVLYGWIEFIRTGVFLRELGLTSVADNTIQFVNHAVLRIVLTLSAEFYMPHLKCFPLCWRTTRRPQKVLNSPRTHIHVLSAWKHSKEPSVYVCLAPIRSVAPAWVIIGNRVL